MLYIFSHPNFSWGFFILLILSCNIVFAASPIVDSVLLEDDDPTPTDELDLNIGTTKLINCSGTVSDADDIIEIDAVFATLYHNETSNSSGVDNGSNHYTNSSCNTTALDPNTIHYNCLFNVQFYANPGLWECNVTVNDSTKAVNSKIDNSTITQLIGIDIGDGNIDFGSLKLGENTVTADKTKTITNIGNIAIDLNLRVYGSNYGDNLSMDCTDGEINASYERWSLTEGTKYALKNESVGDGIGVDVPNFDLAKGVASTKNIYWGMGIPLSPIVDGICSGTIMFIAIADS